jgi:predicted nucleic acid-binding protein
MTFLDTSTLVGALLANHPQHAACLRALQDSSNPISDAHALAETFATLTGFYKVPSEAAAELTLGETAISEARRRGIMGGGIYDSLHATFARRKGAKRVITRNPSHFAHAAPELEVVAP